MPYRRLPNTDQARMRALDTVIQKCSERGGVLLVDSKSLMEARSFLLRFQTAYSYYKECYDSQVRNSHQYRTKLKNAKLYLSHFIQVLNFSIIRGEIKSGYKAYYNLPKEHVVPDLLSEAAVISCGRAVIDGEMKRVSEGGVPIYNPTIAKVKVHYDLFLEIHESYKNDQRLTVDSLEKLAGMRPYADQLILDIWNQLEASFSEIPSSHERLNKCGEYGIIYYYRKGEKRII